MSYQPYDRSPSGIIFFGTNSTDQTFESVSTLVYDSGNNRLGINNAAPSGSLHVDNLQLNGNTLSATNTNGSLILSPNGNGAIQADSGGNTRGTKAVDLQRSRTNASQVASGFCSFIGNGRNNTASANYSTIVNGAANCVTAWYGFIGGGDNNCVFGSGVYGLGSSIVGGNGNYITSSSDFSFIGGGSSNCSCNSMVTIGGGQFNSVSGYGSVIAGGDTNTALQCFSTIGGGYSNCATGLRSTIAGGCNNRAYGSDSTISGGYDNCAGDSSVVVGGSANCASNASAVVGGLSNTTGGSFTSFIGAGAYNEVANGLNTAIVAGTYNIASGDYSAIVAGQNNSIASSALWGFIGAGRCNTIIGTSYDSVVAGGFCNIAASTWSTVSGGLKNCACFHSSTVSGGNCNKALAFYATVGGGLGNTASGYISNIGGGHGNIVEGCKSSIGGGYANCVTGCLSVISGGGQNKAFGYFSTIGGGDSNCANAKYSSILGGYYNITNARHSTINGGHYNIIQSPTNECCAHGATIAGGIGHNTGSGNVDFYTGDVTGAIICYDAGCFSTISGGKRNCGPGNWSTIGGGAENIALERFSTIGGGARNSGSGVYSTVGGGGNNSASGHYSTIGGGGSALDIFGNVALGQWSTIGGGGFQRASGNGSTISGGASNRTLGDYSTIGGGHCNLASGDYSSVVGYSNSACHTNSHIIGSGITSSAADTLYTNKICANNTITGTSIIKSGGTSSEFLKADGSVDSTGYTTCVGTVTSVAAGSGMNFGTITTTGSVGLGTPSDVTLSSTNSLTANSHTHAFAPGGDTTEYIRGDGSLATFPTNVASGVGSSGHIAFWTATNSLSYDNNELFWDQTNNRLGVGTGSPSYELDIDGSGRFTGTLNVNGDLIVNGTTTTVNSTVVTIEDPILVLGSGTPTTDDNKDRGIAFNYFDGSAKQGFFGYDDTEQKFTFMTDATIAGEVVSGTVGTIKADLNGNADTATILETTRTFSVAGDVATSSAQNFNGSANVTLTTTIQDSAITSQDPISSVDGNNDLLLIYESGVGLKKVTPQNLIDDLNIVTSFNVSDGSTDVTVQQGETLSFADGDGAEFVVTEVSGEPTVTVNVDDTVIRTSTVNGQTISQDLIFDCGTAGNLHGYYVSGIIPQLSLIPSILGSYVEFDSGGPGVVGETVIGLDGTSTKNLIITTGRSGGNVGDIKIEPGNNRQVIIGDNSYASSGVQLHTLTSASNAATYFYTNIATGGNTVYKRSISNVKSDLGLSNVENIAVSTLGGSGLYYGGNQLHVGAGTGMSVAADTIGLANTTVSANSYGSASAVATFTVDAQGRLTAAATTAISITASQVSNFNTAAESAIFTSANFVDTDTIDFTVTTGASVSGVVKTNSINENYLTTSVAGDGLAGGNGTALSVNVDDATIEINSDTLRVKGGGIDTTELADGAVTEAKLSRTVDATFSNNDVISADINLVSGGAGGITVKLPAPATGKMVYVKKIDSAVGAVTVERNGASDSIDGATQKILYSQYESLSFVSDGTHWYIV